MDDPSSPELSPSPQKVSGWRGRLIVLLVAVVAGLFLLQIARGGLGSHLPRLGSDVPPLEFQLLDGSTVGLESLRGKIVLLDFWATWCPPCVDSMPIVDKVARELEKDGVVTVAVNRDDLEPEKRGALIRRFLERHELQGLQVALDDGSAADAFHVRGLPTLVVLGPDGKVAAAHLGGIDETELRRLIRPVLSSAGLRGGE